MRTIIRYTALKDRTGVCIDSVSKKLGEYPYLITTLFESFLDDTLTVDSLIKNLNKYETEIWNKSDKKDSVLWFRFNNYDIEATTIIDIENGLIGSRNRNQIINNIKMCVVKRSLKVHFS